MKTIKALTLATAMTVLPVSAFACDACGRKHHKVVSYTPAASYACPAPAPVCAPACPAPCFNPLSIVGGVVTGVGSAIGSIGQGISGAFGSCNPCY